MSILRCSHSGCFIVLEAGPQNKKQPKREQHKIAMLSGGPAWQSYVVPSWAVELSSRRPVHKLVVQTGTLLDHASVRRVHHGTAIAQIKGRGGLGGRCGGLAVVINIMLPPLKLFLLLLILPRPPL